MALPKEKFFVELRRGKVTDYRKVRAGARGGIVNTIEDARTRKKAILAAHPDATVKIHRSVTVWDEVE